MTKKISQLTALTTPDDLDEIVINDTSAGVTKRMKRSDFLSLLIAPGVITAYAAAGAPAGYLLCNGQAVSRSTYANLFAVVGTLFGAGDGSTTFNVPNLKGAVVVGVDAGQTEFNTLAKTGGEKTHTLTMAEMASHTHTQDPHSHSVNDSGHIHGLESRMSGQEASGYQLTHSGGGFTDRALVDGGGVGRTTDGSGVGVSVNGATPTNQTAGSSAAHNNLQPYMALNYIIKT